MLACLNWICLAKPLEGITRTGWMQVKWESSSLPLSLLWSLVLPELTKNGLEKQVPGFEG
jgi:hypothetical protein